MEYNPFSLIGKTILVTGASSGIGREIAIECSKLGATIVCTGRNETRLDEVLGNLAGSGHKKIVADVSSNEGLNKIIAESPEIQGLVNNAGITITLPIPFISDEKLRAIFETNTFAPILLTKGLLSKKKIKKGASIVFTCSVSGTTVGVMGNSMYSATKGAIFGFMKNVALELSSKNIRVNSVAPGMIDTGIMNHSTIDEAMLDEERKKYPLKRFGKPTEVALPIAFLLSDASSFITRTQIVIDGGFTLY